MKPSVYSEIGRLRKVLVHRPGKEVEVVVPELANDLLFEDILFSEKAQSEHEVLCEVLEKYGVQTYQILDLLTETLESVSEEDRVFFINKLQRLEKFDDFILRTLEGMSGKDLARSLVEGILYDENSIDNDHIYLLPPVPNLLFARDPIIFGFNRILASSMAEMARFREAEIMKYIFSKHPEMKLDDDSPIIDLQKVSKNNIRLTIEGGDFLVLDKETVAIAWSKRTSLEAIRILASELKKINVKNLIAVKLPAVTSFIHLDTVFTRINHDECLIFPPLFSPTSRDRSRVFYFDLKGDKVVETEFNDMFSLLDSINIKLRPIYCGGKTDLIQQKREQWTQGANAFTIAPGIIMTYSRNVHTARELSGAGYLCISAEEVLKKSFIPNFQQKTAILIDGNELCRARGGIRCLTHPLLRDSI